jgi:hypothetical protein
MEKLYHYVLNGLKNYPEFYNPKIYSSFEEYLTSLKNHLFNLRKSYQTTNVETDYSSLDTQATYLIAYYPHYFEMIYHILNLISSQLSFAKEVQACFFGAGPCPEVAGLVKFLGDKFPETTNLVANVYDIAHDTWNLTREITKNDIIPKLWNGNIDLQSFSLDICAANSFQSIHSVIKNCQLVVFQNCLNEVENKNTHDFQANFKSLLDNLPLGCSILIVDFLNYDKINAILEGIKRNVERANDIASEKGEISRFKVTTSPSIIKQNLFENKDGLIERKHINFQYLALHKIEPVNDNEDDFIF